MLETIEEKWPQARHSLLAVALLLYVVIPSLAFRYHETLTTSLVLFMLATLFAAGWIYWQTVQPEALSQRFMEIVRVLLAVIISLVTMMLALFALSYKQSGEPIFSSFATLAMIMLIATLAFAVYIHTFSRRKNIKLEWLIIASVSAFSLGYVLVRHYDYWTLRTVGLLFLVVAIMAGIFIAQQTMNLVIDGSNYPLLTTALAALFVGSMLLISICLVLDFFVKASLLWLVIALLIIAVIGMIALSTWQITLTYAGRPYLELLYGLSLVTLALMLWLLYYDLSVIHLIVGCMSIVYVRFFLKEW